MADPHYFFSTLAQASAAVIGFVVAVSVALYSLERQRVERRTDEYRDGLLELRNRYGFALTTLEKMLQNEGGETTDEMLDLCLSSDELSEIAHRESKEHPVTTIFLAHIQRLIILLTRIEPENDYLLLKEELDSLQESVVWFDRHFGPIDSTSDAFIEEVTGKSHSEHENIAKATLFGDDGPISGFSAFQLKGWLAERQKIESEVLRPQVNKESPAEGTESLTGDNFWTLMILSDYLVRDFWEVSKKSSQTIIHYDSGIRPVIKISTYMILVGVFLPTSFLFSSPITLPWWGAIRLSDTAILTSQVTLLLATAALSLPLVEIAFRSAGPSNDMDPSENLSRYSKLVLRVLPDLPT